LINKLFELKNKVVVITGASGSIGGEISASLAESGCRVALLYNQNQPDDSIMQRIKNSKSDFAMYKCDVTSKDGLKISKDLIMKDFGYIDSLINCAGGNHPKATTSNENNFFKISNESFEWVTKLNLMGTVLPCQVFGEEFTIHKKGNIINISSMAAIRPLTKIPAYSSSKAAINSFTRWLSVYMAKEYSTNIRVNAIAPGFFIGKQNRFLLIDKDTGNYTKRGKSIIEHTPMNKFGEPKQLISTVIWLLSDYSDFVTGVLIPVDGGFDAFGGV
tara:strand:+ start:120 stop:941 length:822 start_codon:yes stop_codon:yes gene_type:complete